MKPRLNKGYTPRYTPPFVVRWYDHNSDTWLTWSIHNAFGPAVHTAKTRVAHGHVVHILDAGGNYVWRAAPDAVRNRRHGKKR